MKKFISLLLSAVFLISLISTGVLEYVTGLVIYEFFNGLRLWDYNTEILNFGNIGGFILLFPGHPIIMNLCENRPKKRKGGASKCIMTM